MEDKIFYVTNVDTSTEKYCHCRNTCWLASLPRFIIHNAIVIDCFMSTVYSTFC